MPTKTTFSVTGLRELDRQLGQLTKATARNVLRRTLRMAAEPVVDAAKRHVPVDTGSLKRSIVATHTPPQGADAGKAAYSETLQAGGSRADAGAAMRSARASNPAAFARIFIGPGRHPQAIMQEFGTVNHPPQPFMRPAIDAEAQTAIEIIRTELGTEIEKSAQRIAARKASKGR